MSGIIFVNLLEDEPKMMKEVLMLNFEIHDLFFNRKNNHWLFYLIQGLLIALMGVIILMFPEILIAFVAMIFFIAGFLLIALAVHLRRRRHKLYEVKINFTD